MMFSSENVFQVDVLKWEYFLSGKRVFPLHFSNENSSRVDVLKWEHFSSDVLKWSSPFLFSFGTCTSKIRRERVSVFFPGGERGSRSLFSLGGDRCVLKREYVSRGKCSRYDVLEWMFSREHFSLETYSRLREHSLKNMFWEHSLKNMFSREHPRKNINWEMLSRERRGTPRSL